MRKTARGETFLSSGLGSFPRELDASAPRGGRRVADEAGAVDAAMKGQAGRLLCSGG
jgi:hypothetical protein